MYNLIYEVKFKCKNSLVLQVLEKWYCQYRSINILHSGVSTLGYLQVTRLGKIKHALSKLELKK
jgi:hypothetical protein